MLPGAHGAPTAKAPGRPCLGPAAGLCLARLSGRSPGRAHSHYGQRSTRTLCVKLRPPTCTTGLSCLHGTLSPCTAVTCLSPAPVSASLARVPHHGDSEQQRVRTGAATTGPAAWRAPRHSGGTGKMPAWRRTSRPLAQTDGHAGARHPNGETHGSGRDQAGPGGRSTHVPEEPGDSVPAIPQALLSGRWRSWLRGRSTLCIGSVAPVTWLFRPETSTAALGSVQGSLGLSRRSCDHS